MARIKHRKMSARVGKDNSAEKTGVLWVDAGKGAFAAVMLSLVYVLLLALLIKSFDWSETIIAPANQVAKMLCAFVGAYIAVRKTQKQGWLRGALAAAVYMIVGFAVFSLLQGTFLPTTGYVLDLVIGVLVGAISGAVCVNLKK